MDEEYELEDIDFFLDKPEKTEQAPNKHCKGVDYINTTKVSTALVLPEAKEKSVKVHEYGIDSRKNKEKYY